jgi:hypothetical protein
MREGAVGHTSESKARLLLHPKLEDCVESASQDFAFHGPALQRGTTGEANEQTIAGRQEDLEYSPCRRSAPSS